MIDKKIFELEQMQETLIEDNDNLKLKNDAQAKTIQDLEHLNLMVKNS